MAVSLKHKFNSAKSDGGDASLVRPSNWNDEHDLTLATSRLLGRTTAGGGAAEEIAAGAGLSLSAGQIAAYAPFGDPNVAVFFDDFLGATANVRPYIANNGAVDTDWGGSALAVDGVLILNAGYSTNGRAGYIWPLTDVGGNTAIYFGTGEAIFRSRVRLNVLSDGTNTYAARVGFTRDPASSTPTDALFFEYYPASRGNGNWWAVSRNNSSNRAVDTGVAATSATFQVLEIAVNAAGTEAVSRINGTVVDTNSSNVPSGSSRGTGYGAALTKTAGGETRRMLVDYVLVALHHPSGRP